MNTVQKDQTERDEVVPTDLVPESDPKGGIVVVNPILPILQKVRELPTPNGR